MKFVIHATNGKVYGPVERRSEADALRARVGGFVVTLEAPPAKPAFKIPEEVLAVVHAAATAGKTPATGTSLARKAGRVAARLRLLGYGVPGFLTERSGVANERFANMTWLQLQEGSKNGGRHNILKWAIQRESDPEQAYKIAYTLMKGYGDTGFGA
jgi:hypothetical protein